MTTAHNVVALVAIILAVASIIWPGNKLSKIALVLVAIALIVSCSNGQYVGPSVGANIGYNGVSVGVALYGPNPSAANVSVVKEASPTPATK
jgi:hypothetical protein